MKTTYYDLTGPEDVAVIKLANGKQIRIHQSLSGKITIRSLEGYLVLFPQGGVNTIDIDVIQFGTKWKE